jgi:hypothetical protein
MQRWIEFKQGRFGGIFLSESLSYNGHLVDENTHDEILLELGVLRLKEVPPEFPDLPYVITEGPIYKLAEDGSAEVYENFTYRYETIEEIRQRKLNEWYIGKDRSLREGVTYNGSRYDLRFRNISYLSLLSTLISNDKYPEDFEWFDAEGNITPLSKEDCLGLIKEAIKKIYQLEISAVKKLKKIEGITDIRELLNTNISIEGE